MTFNRAPVAGGEIRFLPAKGPEAAIAINSDGTYLLDSTKDGAVVGQNKVCIEWNKATDQKDEGGAPISAQVIPEKYNLSTTLSVEIKPGKNEHNFDLVSE